jgi:hypothetical protein
MASLGYKDEENVHFIGVMRMKDRLLLAHAVTSRCVS